MLSAEAAEYFAAFLALGRDRQRDSVSLGMAGGVSLPMPVPREAIRREGRRLGYQGDGLDDFVEIVAAIDDFHLETESRRIAAETQAAANRLKRGR